MNTSYRVWITLLLSSFITMFIAHTLAGRSGLLWGGFFSVAFNLYLYLYSDKKMVNKLQAELIEGQDPWNLRGLLSDLCKKAELPLPRLYIIHSPTLSSFAFGRSWHHGSIAITQGLVEQFDHKKIEAILAFHLAQIKRHDTLGISIGCSISSLFTGLNQLLFSKKNQRIAYLYPSYVFSKWVSFVFLGKNSYLKSDHLAKQWVSDPKALATGLLHLEAYFATQPLSLEPDLLMGFPVNPLTKIPISSYLQLHPTLAKRVKAIVGYFPI